MLSVIPVQRIGAKKLVISYEGAISMVLTGPYYRNKRMGKCVYCGNLSNNKKNASLHKFPRNEQLQKEWLKLIGLEGLSTKSSTLLCSEHFTKDCFVVHYNNRKRLKPGAVPTILNKGTKFQETRDVLIETNCRDKAQDVATISGKEKYEPGRNVLMKIDCIDNGEDVGPCSIIKQVPEASIIIEYSDSPTTSKEILSPKKCLLLASARNETNGMKVTHKTQTAHERVFHDHHYEDTPRSMRRKLNDLRRKLNSVMKENRILKQLVGRTYIVVSRAFGEPIYRVPRKHRLCKLNNVVTKRN